MPDSTLPNLTFPDLSFGRYETPWDLRSLLYRGGAGTNTKKVGLMIDAGELGRPLVERIELVGLIHEVIANSLGRGARKATACGQIVRIRGFVRWVDETKNQLSLETVEGTYLQWTDALLHRSRACKEFSEASAYGYGLVVGTVLDRVLGRTKPIIKTTLLRMPKRGMGSISTAADKQNLEATFEFGRFLLDISDGLSLDAVWGSLPVRIQLRNGKVLEEWSGLKRPETLKVPNPRFPSQARYSARLLEKLRTEYVAEHTLRTRYPLCRLRIMVEMLMLMAQPSINLAQVFKLRMDQWKFKPVTNGFEIRTYKHRRWGPVVFEIYSEYRKIFDRYLKWRAKIFPNDPDGLLFPLISYGRNNETPPSFSIIKVRCQQAGISYFSPSALRNTNVNWMLRRTNDPDLTADEKQHSKRTLLRNYEKPSLQIAMVQIKDYWAQHDPAQAAAGPGACIGDTPMPNSDISASATKPDCLTPAGCLFCDNQRDIDTLDHVWSLASYRLLKSYELAADRQLELKIAPPLHPAELAIDRLTLKLTYIKESGSGRESWVKEALLRIEEGRYHPDWAGMIETGKASGDHPEK